MKPTGGRSKNAGIRRPPSGRPSRRGGGVAGYFALTAAVGMLVALGVALVAAWEARSRTEAATLAEAESTAELLARALSAEAEGTRRALARLGSRPALHDALRDGDQERLAGFARDYRTAFPGAFRLLIAPAEGIAPRPDADPPIGYALVDLISAVVEDGTVAQEVHLPGRAEAHLDTVAPVRAGDAVVGVLVLTQSLERLRGLATPPARGRTEVSQGAGSGQATIVTAGRGAAGPRHSLPVEGTPWRLSYTAATPVTTLTGILGQPSLAIALGLGILVIGLAAYAAARRLHAVLAADVREIASLARDVSAGEPRRSYPVRLRILEEALQAAATLAREHTPARTAERLPAADAAGRAHPDTGRLSGIEVVEGPAALAASKAGPSPTETSGTAAGGTPHGSGTEPVPSRVDPSIVRAYDIRGVVGRTLTPEVVEVLGRAIGGEAAERGQDEIVVARDGRRSSAELAEALSAGLLASGRVVLDIGLCPTPVMYFATHHLGTRAGVVVTGSHNPPEYNGLKIILDGETLHGDSIKALIRRVETGDLPEAGGGRKESREVLAEYIEDVAQDVVLHRPLKVVVDCGNGAAGEVAPRLFRTLGCEVEELYCEVDGDFPNHHPDPSVPGNLEALIERVRGQRADLGLAFDGDGDRLGVVDNRGNIIWPDRQLMLFARDVLIRNPGADIVFDVKCTNRLAEVITENAGVPVIWKTGRSLIRSKLKETGAPLAGEMSGHLFFNDRWYGFDDGPYAGARLLEILAADPRDSAEVFAELPAAIGTPEIRVDLAEGEPQRVMAALLERASFSDARLTTIDGLRVDFPDGWGLARASNTQPCLVLRFEGDDDAALKRIQERFRGLLEQAGPGIRLPF